MQAKRLCAQAPISDLAENARPKIVVLRGLFDGSNVSQQIGRGGVARESQFDGPQGVPIEFVWVNTIEASADLPTGAGDHATQAGTGVVLAKYGQAFIQGSYLALM
ncbi:MAG: hypothetical protein ACI8W8_001561 [Rhodothermales bacterium]|jgi:hypothetical protein